MYYMRCYYLEDDKQLELLLENVPGRIISSSPCITWGWFRGTWKGHLLGGQPGF